MKLAIAVPNLSASQLNFHAVMQANAVLHDRVDTDIIFLFENVSKPCLAISTAAMHIAEGWGFDGAVVATTVSTAEKLLRFPSVSRRFFYAWDLEYLRPARRDFRHFQAIYAHPELELFARSEDHADALKNAWNKKVGIIPEEGMVEDFLKLAA